MSEAGTAKCDRTRRLCGSEARGAPRDVAQQSDGRKLAAVGKLTANLSHEIGNPLNSCPLQLEVLARRIQWLPAEAIESLSGPLNLARDEIRRLSNNVRNILDLAGPQRAELVGVNRTEIVSQVVSFLSTEAEHRGTELRSHTPVEVLIGGDADQLRHVEMNLMLNALDAAGREGVVEVM